MKKLISLFLAMVFVMLVFTACGPKTPVNPAPDWEQTHSLPVVKIGSAMEDIHRTERHWTNVSVIGSELNPDGIDFFEFENANMQIRGRGQSSWHAAVGNAPYSGKRPFRIRFANTHDTTREQNDFIRPVLDSGFAAREWTFVPNQIDKTLMRNYSIYYLSRLLAADGLGIPFGTNARLVHVYMADTRRTVHHGDTLEVVNTEHFNGNWIYQGIYHMSDQLNQPQAERVNIITNNNPEISEFLLEMCRHELARYRNPASRAANPNYPHMRYPDDPWPRPHVIINENVSGEMPFMIEAGGRADDHAQFPQTAAYVENFLQNVDAALRSRDLERIKQWIDIPSFVDFYLVQELALNIDVNTSSVRFTIRGQGEHRRLFAGPLWDFDRSGGNVVNPALPEGGYSPIGEWMSFRNPWFANFIVVPELREQTRERWDQIKDNQVKQMLDRLDYMTTTYAHCFHRNFERWQIFGMSVSPLPTVLWRENDYFNIHSHRGQVDFLIDFLEQRIEWISEWL